MLKIICGGIAMAENLEGLFKKISFEEAYQQVKTYDGKLQEFTKQGAVIDGERELDQKYTACAQEVAKYYLQFSQEELLTLLGKMIEEQETIKKV